MTGRSAVRGLAAALAAGSLILAQGAAAEPELRYEPPAPGSYELPTIDRVSDHALLASSGEPTSLLAGLGPGQVALVSFVYRSCTDAAGCPLALAVMSAIDRRLAQAPDLRGRVQLITVSFDPEHDRPAVMAHLAESMAARGDWRFLTARDTEQLEPLLRDFGQDVTLLRDDAGDPTGQISHVLKVFLLDGRRAVRNVYSTGFLHSQLVLNDARTVLGLPDPSAARPADAASDAGSD